MRVRQSLALSLLPVGLSVSLSVSLSGCGLIGGNAIGPEGGAVQSSDGQVTLDIPAGALDATQQIAIERDPGEFMAYTFTPDGLSFNVPATVTFVTPAPPADTPDLLPWGWGLQSDSTELGVETLENTQVEIWDQGNRIWDQGNRVSTDIQHFSVVSMPGVSKGNLEGYVPPAMADGTLEVGTFASVMIDDTTPGFQATFQAPSGVDLSGISGSSRNFFVALLADGMEGDPEFPVTGAVCKIVFGDNGLADRQLFPSLWWFDPAVGIWETQGANLTADVQGNLVTLKVPARDLDSPFVDWALPGVGVMAAGPITDFVFGSELDGTLTTGKPGKPMRWMAGGTIDTVQ